MPETLRNHDAIKTTAPNRDMTDTVMELQSARDHAEDRLQQALGARPEVVIVLDIDADEEPPYEFSLNIERLECDGPEDVGPVLAYYLEELAASLKRKQQEPPRWTLARLRKWCLGF